MNIVIDFFLDKINTICQKLLALDPELSQHLVRLAGKVFEIKIQNLPKFYLVFLTSTIKVQSQYIGSIDATLQGDIFSMANAFFMLRDKRETKIPPLNIQGDIEAVQKFSQFVQEFDIDWEEQLAQYSGDVFAHALVTQIRNFVTWGQKSSQQFKNNLVEYLQEECRLMPGKEEVEDFYHNVAQLRDDVERAQIRFELLVASIVSKKL